MTPTYTEYTLEERCKIHELQELHRNLFDVNERVAVEGMSRGDADLLNRLIPTTFANTEVRKFTALPSATGSALALEAIDWKRVGIMSTIAAAIVALIAKLFSWLSSSIKTAGGRAGGVADIDKTNKSISKDVDKLAPVEVVAPVSTDKLSAAVVDTISRNSKSVSNNYFNVIRKLAADGKLSPIKPDVVARAISSYEMVVSKTGASDRDTELHALLGYMLTARGAGIPVNLADLPWSGRTITTDIPETILTAIPSLMSHIGNLIDSITSTIHAISNLDKSTMVNVIMQEVSGVPLLNGTVGDATRVVSAIQGMQTDLARVINVIEHDSALTGVAHVNTRMKHDELNWTSIDTTKLGLHPKVELSMQNYAGRSRKYISLWDAESYNSFNEVADVTSYIDTLKKLATVNGRKELSKLYEMYFQTKNGKATGIFTDRIDAINDKLTSVANDVKALESKKDEEGYIRRKFWAPVAEGGKGKVLQVLPTVNNTLTFVQGISDILSKVNTYALSRSTAIDDSIKVMEKAAVLSKSLS